MKYTVLIFFVSEWLFPFPNYHKFRNLTGIYYLWVLEVRIQKRVSRGFTGFHGASWGFKGVSQGFIRFHGASRGFRGLHGASWGSNWAVCRAAFFLESVGKNVSFILPAFRDCPRSLTHCFLFHLRHQQHSSLPPWHGLSCLHLSV